LSIEDMRLDLIRWRTDNAEQIAESEYKELCREKPREYGDKPGCKKLNTYKVEFFQYLIGDIQYYIVDASDSQIRREWETESPKHIMKEERYAE